MDDLVTEILERVMVCPLPVELATDPHVDVTEILNKLAAEEADANGLVLDGPMIKRRFYLARWTEDGWRPVTTWAEAEFVIYIVTFAVTRKEET